MTSLRWLGIAFIAFGAWQIITTETQWPLCGRFDTNDHGTMGVCLCALGTAAIAFVAWLKSR